MKDTPLGLETLSDVPCIVKRNSYMTKLDDASGHLHILMTQSSRPLLGFQWGGHYFWSNDISFGWEKTRDTCFIIPTYKLCLIYGSCPFLGFYTWTTDYERNITDVFQLR